VNKPRQANSWGGGGGEKKPQNFFGVGGVVFF